MSSKSLAYLDITLNSTTKKVQAKESDLLRWSCFQYKEHFLDIDLEIGDIILFNNSNTNIVKNNTRSRSLTSTATVTL